MHFQFLIEDASSTVLIQLLMRRFSAEYSGVTFDCKPFKGLGGLTKRNTVKETKTGKLLNDLATYLRGFDKSLRDYDAVVMVVLDNDTRNTDEFMSSLEDIASQRRIQIDHAFCIAVEEVEAWLLGDEAAVRAAYPSAKTSVLHRYRQDSICGTWETLADAVFPGGMAAMRKKKFSFVEIGKCKSEWAKNIGEHMDIDANRSPSFRHFIEEIKRRLHNTTP